MTDIHKEAIKNALSIINNFEQKIFIVKKKHNDKINIIRTFIQEDENVRVVEEVFIAKVISTTRSDSTENLISESENKIDAATCRINDNNKLIYEEEIAKRKEIAMLIEEVCSAKSYLNSCHYFF